MDRRQPELFPTLTFSRTNGRLRGVSSESRRAVLLPLGCGPERDFLKYLRDQISYQMVIRRISVDP